MSKTVAELEEAASKRIADEYEEAAINALAQAKKQVDAVNDAYAKLKQRIADGSFAFDPRYGTWQ